MLILDLSMVNVALPSIQGVFGSPREDLQWVVAFRAAHAFGAGLAAIGIVVAALAIRPELVVRQTHLPRLGEVNPGGSRRSTRGSIARLRLSNRTTGRLADERLNTHASDFTCSSKRHSCRQHDRRCCFDRRLRPAAGSHSSSNGQVGPSGGRLG
jgi:hypothetical protein